MIIEQNETNNNIPLIKNVTLILSINNKIVDEISQKVINVHNCVH